MKLIRLILKGTTTVLAATLIIFIWTYWYKELNSPQFPPDFIWMLLIAVIIITTVTIITWLGLNTKPKSKKSKNFN